MRRPEAWFHHTANILVGGTGVVYAYMLYFMTPEDEFSIWNHPWQGTTHDAHLLTAPLLMLSLGMLWANHARPRLRSKQRAGRRSGLFLLIHALPMIFSGVLLQIAVQDFWREAWKVIHLATSLLWMAGYLGHQLRQWRTPAH